MNRQEFSAKLVKIKNKAHVKLKDSLPYALQLNQNKVNALEKATFEYVMGNVFIYLKNVWNKYGTHRKKCHIFNR